MRKLLAALAFLAALIPASGLGQQFPLTLPANTLYGRLGIGTGPGQAIPLSVLATQPLFTSRSLGVGTTPIAGGTNGNFLYNNAGTLGNLNLFGSTNTWSASQSITNSQNSTLALGVLNTNSGTGALAALAVGNGSVLGNIGAGGVNYVPIPLLQNKIFVNSAGGGGIAVLTNDAQPITLGTNGTVRGSIDGAGLWTINGGPLVIGANSNSVIGATVTNASTGIGAAAAWGVNNGASLGNFGITASTYTLVPMVTNRTFVNASGGSGLALLTNDAQPIVLGTNNAIRASIAGGGPFVISPVLTPPTFAGLQFSINKNTVGCPAMPAATIVHWMGQFCGADGERPGMMIDSFGTGATTSFGAYSCRRSNGTAAAPTALKSGDLVCVLGGLGAYGNSLWSLDQWQIRYYASQDWNTTSWGSDIAFLTTPNNSTTVAEGMRLSNAGFFGVGTDTPQSRVHINANTTKNVPQLDNNTVLQVTAADDAGGSVLLSGFGAGFAGWVSSHAGGTAAAPTQTAANTVIGYVGGRARTDAAAYTGVGAQFSFETSQAQTAAAQGKRITVFTTPNGSTTITAGSRFENSGGITVPPTVTGGDKGAGSINATQHYQAGVALPTYSNMLGGSALNVNLNAGATDTAIAITSPTTNYRINGVLVKNKGTTASLTTATVGMFTTTGGGGVVLFADQSLNLITSNAVNTANGMIQLTGTNSINTWLNLATLQFRVGTAQGAAATADIYVYIQPLP